MVDGLEMAGSVVVKKLDAGGRVVIPSEWRRSWGSGSVVLRRRGERVEISPLEAVPPSALFDSIPVADDVDFADPHSLRKGLLEPRTP